MSSRCKRMVLAAIQEKNNENLNGNNEYNHQFFENSDSEDSVEHDEYMPSENEVSTSDESSIDGDNGTANEHETKTDNHSVLDPVPHVTADGKHVGTVREISCSETKKKQFSVVEKMTRKRKRNEKEWKRKKAALARERGECYTSYNGKQIPAKTPILGVLCKENCRLKCGENFNIQERNMIHSKFYKLDINCKNTLLFKSIDAHDIKRRTVKAHSKRSISYSFWVTCNTRKQQVCKAAFCALYGIGRKKVELIQKQIKEGKPAPSPDSRERHSTRPHRVDEAVIEYVKCHINSFPAEESHYSRHRNPHKLFLSPLLNISQMHRLYFEKCSEEQKPESYYIKKSTYSSVFSTYFNYSFGLPKSDTCSTCDAGTTDSEHKENYAAAFQLQQIDRAIAASEDSNMLYVTVDLQQTMPLRKLTTSKAFYLRQMWFYNLGVHSITNDCEKSFLFTWTEDVARRGSSEITSALCTFVENNAVLVSQKKHLTIWSDSCSGQNKNFQMICLYQYFILKGYFSVIDHKFPEVGHSYLDSDRDFGRIEKRLRKHETIFLPDQYRDVIRTAPKNNHVTDMTNNFRDMTTLQTQLKIVQPKKNVQNEKIMFRDNVKWIRVDEFGSYLYKTNYDPYSPFQQVSLLKNKNRRPDPENVYLRRLTQKTGEISEKKMQNLKEQLKYVKQEFRWFYEDIIGDVGVVTNRRRTT